MLMDDEEAARYKGWEEQGGISNERMELSICEAKNNGDSLYCSKCDLFWKEYEVVPERCLSDKHNKRLLKTFGCEMEGNKCERCKARYYTNESRPSCCIAMEKLSPAKYPTQKADHEQQEEPRPKMTDGEIVAAIMQEMAATFKERNSTYGSNYLAVPKLVAALFPEGVPPELVMSNQWHLFELILVKLSRFAISRLTHVDSIHDMAVYSAMIEMILTREERQK